MTKNHIFLTCLLGALTSTANAGNLRENWGDFQTLKTRAAEPSIADEVIVEEFKSYRTKTNQHVASGRDKFIAANEPFTNFQANYGPLRTYHEAGGAPNEEAKTALSGVEACLQERLDDQMKKWKLFTKLKNAIDETPEDRTQITTQLTALDQLFAESSLTPEARYQRESTGSYTYTPEYIIEQYTAYATAEAVMPLQSALFVVSPAIRSALEEMGVSVQDVTAKVNETDGSVWRFLHTRKEKWKGLAGNKSYVAGDSISPALPL